MSVFQEAGHHLLVNILARYFGNDPYLDSRSIETSKDMSHFTAGELVYCEYYSHCNKIPCTDPTTNYQKYHDTDLKLTIKLGQYYIVQYRNPYRAIISNFKVDTQVFKSVEDSQQSWKMYLGARYRYYKGFYKKWVAQKDHPHVCVLKYEDLICSPLEKAREVIVFVKGNLLIDAKKLEGVIHSLSNHEQSSVESFRYYDKNDEERLSDETL